MIINFPTGLYKSVLPSEPSDDTSVTFTISSNDPPKSEATFLTIPEVEILRPIPKIEPGPERRKTVGELVFGISSGSQGDIGSSKKAFEVGQILDFGDIENKNGVDTNTVPDVIELQQNTNLLDLSSLGLSEIENIALVSSVNERFNELTKEINDVKSQIKNVESNISENQKQINEVRKALNAALVVFDSTGSSIINTLEEKEDELLDDRTALIESRNGLVELNKDKYDELLSLRELVR